MGYQTIESLESPGKEGLQAMKASRRRMAVGAALLALFIAVPAAAQENIDAGKTPAQLYAQDCAICHKTPHGLSKAAGAWGLQGFLREHYTASHESAAAIAAYLAAIDRKTPPRHRGRANHKTRSEKAKKADSKLPPHRPSAKAEAKSKPEPKPPAKLESKPEEAKKSETPKSEAKSKPVEAKAETKTEAKTNGAKAPGAKPENKPD